MEQGPISMNRIARNAAEGVLCGLIGASIFLALAFGMNACFGAIAIA